ncbi:hypothetical protein ACIBCC_30000 [Streptomyces griseus]|uniref:hypothetical protein n=1 Tax=Streptomyces griseus TaxID=1911 RepID=UPI003791F2F1
MGAKNQALKNAARRRMAETGQSYEAALLDVRREYEQGQHGDEDHQGPMGFDEAPSADEYRPTAKATAYITAWGIEDLFGRDQMKQLVQHAEKHGVPGAYDPITCHLCDEPVIVTQEKTVHIGLTLLQKMPSPGLPAPDEVTMPVWTHDSCGHPRVWAWSQLTLERRRRGLPVDTAHLPAKQHRRGRTQPPVEDYYVFTVPENSPPLFYLQPGEDHRHGPLGFRADRLSDGLPTLDFSREAPRALGAWSIAADRTGLLHIERQGTGRWYQPPRPWSPPADWLAAAHYHQGAIVLTAPAGSIPTARLEADTGDLSGLLPVGRREQLFGGRMTISGLS